MRPRLATVMCGLALAACQQQNDGTASELQRNAAAPGRAQTTTPADNGNWEMPSKDYAATRFSALNQINTDNIKGIGLAFTFSTGTTKGFEAPPLVVGSTMYVVTPFP